MQAVTQSPASPPLPPLPPLPEAVAQTPAIAPGTTVTASEVYEGFKAQRNELNRQLSGLEEKRRAIASRLRDGEVTGADKAGLESRLTELDGRIKEMYKQVATADAQVAQAAAAPGAVVEEPRFVDRGGPPMEVIWMGFTIAMTLILPISLAFARRVWRRGSTAAASASMPRELDDRLSRLEQAMDAVAVEVERVGEGQRYVTRVLGSGAAEPLAVRSPERVEVKR